MKYLVPFRVEYIGYIEVEADNKDDALYQADMGGGREEVEERLKKLPFAYFDLHFVKRSILKAGAK